MMPNTISTEEDLKENVKFVYFECAKEHSRVIVNHKEALHYKHRENQIKGKTKENGPSPKLLSVKTAQYGCLPEIPDLAHLHKKHR